jgi:hypothetical protein
MEYSRKFYEAYRERQIVANTKYRRGKKGEWDDYKATLKCTKCGFNHHAALDFHHEDPSTKEGDVNRYVSNGQFKRAYKEIEKCIVLCANCHRVYHFEERKNPAL